MATPFPAGNGGGEGNEWGWGVFGNGDAGIVSYLNFLFSFFNFCSKLGVTQFLLFYFAIQIVDFVVQIVVLIFKWVK